MPQRVRQIIKSKIPNSSDNTLGYLNASAMSILAYYYARPGTSFQSIPMVEVPFPEGVLPAICGIYLFVIALLLFYTPISNISLIRKINSPSFRAQLISEVSKASTENLDVENLRNRLKPYLIYLNVENIQNKKSEVTSIIIEPIQARAFWFSMHLFRVECFFKNGVFTEYKTWEL
jgi:phenylpyruvate tautomerase PptA (4-oxalocrotonate tautomerase family)